MEQASESEKQSFWDHLDILRASLVKIAAVMPCSQWWHSFSRRRCFLLFLLPRTLILLLIGGCIFLAGG